MTLLLARLLISAALFVVPFALLALGSKGEHAAMWLLFPIFAAIPGILGALILFAPVEAMLDARGLQSYKNVAVPAAGALIAPILFIVMIMASGKVTLALGRLANGGINGWGPIGLWMLLGAVFGMFWRLTAWLAALMGISNG